MMLLEVRLSGLVKGYYSSGDRQLISRYIEINETKSFREILESIYQNPKIKEHLNHLENTETQVTFLVDGWDFSLYNQDDAYCEIIKTNILKYKNLTIIYPTNDSPNKTENPLLSTVIPDVTPLIFLDVDGVINFDYYQKDTSPDIKHCTVISSREFPIIYSETIVDRINKWSDVAEIRWLTSWSHNAKYRLAPALGFKNFGVEKLWKSHLNRLSDSDLNRPIVWIDDELKIGYSKTTEYLTERVKSFLPICPNGALTLNEIDNIDEFIGLVK